MRTAERILGLLVNGDGKTFSGSGDDYRLHAPAEAIAAEIDALRAELEALRLVMDEQKRIDNMPRSYSVGG